MVSESEILVTVPLCDLSALATTRHDVQEAERGKKDKIASTGVGRHQVVPHSDCSEGKGKGM